MTPNDWDGINDFNYEKWTPGTTIRLVNVPWISDYQDVVMFNDRQEQTDYFMNITGLTHEVSAVAYARPGEPVRISLPFNDAYRFNYLMVWNKQSHVNERGRYFYYFIQDVRHIAPNVTELTIMLDVWQTYQFDVTLGRAYVEQGHVGIAEKRGFDSYGRDYLMEPEGLETGAEMVTISAKSRQIGSDSTSDDGWTEYDILVWSNTKLHGIWGKVDDPKMSMSEGQDFQGLPQGANCYVFRSPSDFTTFTERVSAAPWIAQGIIAIHVVPNGLVPEQTIHKTYEGETEAGTKFSGKLEMVGGRTPRDFDITIHKNFRSVMWEYMGQRYRRLSKFATAPYSMVEITTYTGAPLMLRPECIHAAHLTVRRFADLALPSPRVVLMPIGYNARSYDVPPLMSDINASAFFQDVDGDYLDVQTGIYNFPTLSILNNNYLAYMSSNAHSIAFQYSNADWSQTKALRGNDLAFDQSSAGIELNSNMNSLNNETAVMGGAINAVSSIGNAAVGGGLNKAAGVAGAAMGVATTAANTGLTVYGNNRRTAMQNSNASYMRDSNKAYADFAARGDYAQAIAGINARSQDMKVVAPTTIGQMGGDQFALMYLRWSVFAKIKMLQKHNLVSIGEYWLRYGYRINRFVDFKGSMQSLHVMTKFSYWRMSECYITTSRAPEAYRATIRGILTKGVTVWRNPADIGVTDPGTNDPIMGEYL